MRRPSRKALSACIGCHHKLAVTCHTWALCAGSKPAGSPLLCDQPEASLHNTVLHHVPATGGPGLGARLPGVRHVAGKRPMPAARLMLSHAASLKPSCTSGPS